MLKRIPTMLPGIILILLVVALAIYGSYFVDLDLTKINSKSINLPPSNAHLLGTQSEGRDVLAILAVGTPATLKIGLIGGIVALTIGTLLGLIVGYYGGHIDTVIRSVVDIGFTIPPLALLIMLAAALPKINLTMMGFAVALTAWMHPTRVIRSQVLSLRERAFVDMSRLSGASGLHIMVFEILPNLLPFLAASFIDAVSMAILSSIGLEILGLGSGDPTLGRVIYFAISYTAMWRGMWWWWLPPIVILMTLFLGMFMVSVALDNIANPKLYRGAK